MPKSKEHKVAAQPTPSTTATSKLAAKDEAVDPALASLFASSSGPVKVQPRALKSAKTAPSQVQPKLDDDETSSSGSDSSEENDDENDLEVPDEPTEEETSTPEQEAKTAAEKPRKRKRAADGDDLEQAYFKRLELEEDRENRKREPKEKVDDNGEGTSSEDDAYASDSDDGSSLSEPSSVEILHKHETFDNKLKDQDKLNRTVFLGNVSTQAIKTKAAKRALFKYLRSVLKRDPLSGKRPGKLLSVRFRSTAYASGQGPKKATYAKKELMDATTVSTNAYAVFSTAVAAELVAEKLNGTVVLDRHMRVDYLAKPSPIDHKRCVFIGNLSFVNEEAPPSGDGADGEEGNRRPRAKEPADAEEGLWRTFSKVGEVESVRVVRDQETRVGKGFAYVQFKDENSVEAALLMNDKKFPPMLPRKLRVMRARKMKIKPHTISARGKPAGDRRDQRQQQPLIFEGHRATGGELGGGSSKKNRDRKRKAPNSKAAQRSAQYRAAKARKQKLEWRLP
ncbi:uncharacterized protein Z520_05234 [Fonsecaea multimorphosa CBS 102226]|uniref:Nucleolar protein 12 n=1 Tax=Fonsecaea multimorphosa CBS 102226 TaxID=1442371 RepID=A0A0D2KPW2_9EURO|nr:uncharacterized protein Z520_05234 [Fonsecaea multimorphosa CBS 102226]KIX98773.1 hypothetical protein Z520_05234 [Fonsecaea multimorphosa CBS 102226]OAL25054.1 hypothetical protein AYO22_04931 [Fonsecaea multimorphosa]